MRFLKWKYGLEPIPEEVKPKTLDKCKWEDDIVKKALSGKLVEKPAKVAPEKGAGIRKFNVFVDDSYYAVEVESEGGAIIAAPVVAAAPRPAAAPNPSAAPAAAPKPAAAPAAAAPAAGGAGAIAAPMPGLIVEVTCSVGDKVKAGQQVVVLEAMKMQNPLSSLIDGEVKGIFVKAGDSVAVGQVLVDIG
jgi:biotin carboxyl carrier protein